MSHEIIYYPHVEIRDPAWLRSSILFWDKIKVIVPNEQSNRHFNVDMRNCLDERIIEEIRVRNHPLCVEDASNFMINNWEKISANLRSVPHNKFYNSYDRSSYSDNNFIHPEKMSYHLSNIFRDSFESFEKDAEKEIAHRKSRHDDNRDKKWIAADHRFSLTYMALLAEEIARSTNSHATTEYHQFRPPYTSDRLHVSEDMRGNKLIDIVIENTIIDPEADIRKIIKFRKDRRSQLDALHGYIYEMKDLIERDSYIDSAKYVYNKKIKPEIESLRSELSSQTIGWIGGGLLAFSAAPSSSSAIANMFNISPVTALSATAGMILIGSVTVPIWQSRMRKNAHNLAYIMNVDQRFSIDETQSQVRRQFEQEKRNL